jgi:hypothetical protein
VDTNRNRRRSEDCATEHFNRKRSRGKQEKRLRGKNQSDGQNTRSLVSWKPQEKYNMWQLCAKYIGIKHRAENFPMDLATCNTIFIYNH